MPRCISLYQQVKNDLEIQGNEAVLSEVAVPTVYGTSADNLQAAVDGEHFENSQLYPEFAQEAENAGYPEIATRIRGIIAAETEHEERYQKLLTLVTDGKVFERTEKVAWIVAIVGTFIMEPIHLINAPRVNIPKIISRCEVKIFKSKSKESKNSSHLFYFFIFFLVIILPTIYIKILYPNEDLMEKFD